MPHPDRNSLVGKNFIASIGEPWDFHSISGDNTLSGTILSVSDSNSSSQYILLETGSFEYENTTINHVLAVNRYSTSQDIFQEIFLADGATVNFLFRKDGRGLSEETIRTENLHPNEYSFLVETLSVKNADRTVGLFSNFLTKTGLSHFIKKNQKRRGTE